MDSRSAAAPRCPNKDCGKEQQLSLQGGYCGECKDAWLRCQCGAGVSPLWRHCPNCGADVGELESLFQEAPPASRETPAQKLEIDEPVYTAPINYGGYLWWLATSGNLYRISPAGRADLVETLGSDFARASIALIPQRAVSARQLHATRPLSKPSGDDPFSQRVLIAIAGSRHLVLLDPATAGADTRPPGRRMDLPSGLRVAEESDALTTIASDGVRIAILVHSKDSATRLALRDMHAAAGSQWKLVDIPELPVAGPLCIGNTFAVSGKRALYLLRETELEKHPFPDEFEGLVPQEPIWEIARPWRRSPFFSTLNGILIPGKRKSSSPGAFTAAYLSGVLESGARVRFTAIPVPQGSMPSELSGVRLAFAASGELKELDQSTITTVSSEMYLSALPCAIAPELWAAYLDKPSRQREIRLIPGNRPHFKLDSPNVQPIGLHICHNWLVSTGLRQNGFPLIQSWSLK